MGKAEFSDIRACVFDAYGTLLDFNTAANAATGDIGDRKDALLDIWRQKQLQYTWLRSLMRAHVPFWQVTGEALDYAMAVVGIADDGLRERLMQGYLTLDAFPEVPETLRAIRNAGLGTAILTNGSPEMIEAGVRYAGIDDLIDAILSVEEVGIYKPDPQVYQLAVDRLGVPRDRIMFLSSNAWDAAGAAQFGFRVVWCNRYRQPPEQLPAVPDAEVRSLEEILTMIPSALG